MTAGEWYADSDRLLGELQRAHQGPTTPVLPGYDDLVELKRGGQGVVYLATQRSTQRRVAIKVLLDGAFASSTSRARFEREASLVAALRHPNIVAITDRGTAASGQTFFAMEYIAGRPFDEWAAQDRDPRRIAGMLARIADALQHAHQHGIIHRDLKASNLRVDEHGDPHLLDFGLARQLDPEVDATALSTSGEFVGSLPWASPEQARGSATLADVRSDVYSLGVVAWQALAGSLPFSLDGGLHAVLERITQGLATPLGQRAPDVPADLATIVHTCLQLDPERRYQSAADLARDLRAWLAGEPIAAHRDSAWYVLSKQLRRHRAAAAALATIFVVAVGSSIVLSFALRRTQVAEADATSRLFEALAVNDFHKRLLEGCNPDIGGRDIRLIDLLATADTEIDAAVAAGPRTEAAVRLVVGTSWLALGKTDTARPHLERAMALRIEHEPPGTLPVLDVVKALVRLYVVTGEYGAAETLLATHLPLAEAAFGPDSAAVNDLRVSRGAVWMQKGDLPQAITELQQALAGLDRDGTAGRNAAAAANNLALALQRTGRNDEAEPAFVDAIERDTLALGELHPTTLTARNNLAMFLVERGRFPEARTEFEAVLALREEALGPEHPDTLVTIGGLVTLLMNLGDVTAATPLAERCRTGLVAARGPDSPDALGAGNNLANVWWRTGRQQEAKDLLADVLARRERIQGPKHREVLMTADSLTFFLWKLGDRQAALALAQRTLPVMIEVLGEAQPDVANAHSNLGTYLEALGHLDEAGREYDAAIATAEACMPRDHVTFGTFLLNRGVFLARRDDLATAERDLLRAHGIFLPGFGDQHGHTNAAARELAEIYRRLGRADEAAVWRAKMIK